jgi:hypothetical protein
MEVCSKLEADVRNGPKADARDWAVAFARSGDALSARNAISVLASLGDWLRAEIIAARFAVAGARFVTSVLSRECAQAVWLSPSLA